MFDTPSPGLSGPSFKITLKSPTLPEARPQRNFPHQMQNAIDAEINKLLSEDVIEPCAIQQFCSPLVPVSKKDGSLRLCVDYSLLNRHTTDFQFTIPDPRQLLDCLAGKQWFATLDLKSGFHQILLDPDSASLSAFTTRRGFFRFKRLPFGLKNAPKFFQAVMSDILRTELYSSCALYIDDIVVFGKSWSDFLGNLSKVLTLLRAAGVRLNRSKCQFGTDTISYLGYVIDRNGITLSDSRVEDIIRWKEPRTRRQLRSFLGTTNFFRSFIPNYASLVLPLTPLMGVKTPFTWTDSHRDAFQALKSSLAERTKLAHPDYSRPLILRADASDLALGAVLFQRDDSGAEYPLAFSSCPLKGAQRSYSVMEKELLAIVHSVDKFRHFLVGHSFILQTDHRNLLYLDKSMSPKVLRWRQRLLEYSFTLEHIPGSDNTVADALSRAYAITAEHPHLTAMSEAHNSLTGHRGLRLSLAALREAGHEWSTMREDMQSFIHSCSFCQKNKSVASDPSKSTILVPEPFDTVAVDTLGPLPASPEGHQYIIVLIDTFSRFVELRPAPDTSALSAAKAIVDVFGRFGAPRHIKTDGGTQYSAALISALLERLQTQHIYSIPYRPSSNGVVERANREVLRHLRALVYDSRLPECWPDYLPLVQRILNATPCAISGIAPVQLVFGNRVSINRGLLHPFSGNDASESEASYVRQLSQMQGKLIELVQKAQDAYISRRQAADPTPPDFAIGAFVLLPHFKNPPHKLSHKLRGPYEVVRKLSAHSYRVRHLVLKRQLTVHVSQMVPYQASLDRTAIEVAALDTTEYFVDSIVSHSGTNIRSLKFVVRWSDCGAEDDSELSYSEVKELAALEVYLQSNSDLRRLIEDHERKGSVMDVTPPITVTVNPVTVNHGQRQTRSRRK
jgi:hypothetical protein